MKALSHPKEMVCVGLLTVMALARVFSTNTIGCPEYFDCESYIHMTQNLLSPDAPGHHAMRVFPILLVKGLMGLGLSTFASFQAWVALAYLGFGLLSYGLFRQKLSPWLALGFSLLLMSLHEAMKVPMVIVYQLNDMLVYPIGLLLIIATCQKRAGWALVLSVLGALTRQNLFVLGVFSLIWLGAKSRAPKIALYLIILVGVYGYTQYYYGATGVFQALLSPPPGFFTPQHQWDIIRESQILELGIVLLPFALFLKPTAQWLIHHWFALLYACITIGQPYLGYHLTGNNLPRLALQGVWVIALALFWVAGPRLSNRAQWATLAYGLTLFWSWGLELRLLLAAAMTLLYAYEHKQQPLKEIKV